MVCSVGRGCRPSARALPLSTSRSRPSSERTIASWGSTATSCGRCPKRGSAAPRRGSSWRAGAVRRRHGRRRRSSRCAGGRASRGRADGGRSRPFPSCSATWTSSKARSQPSSTWDTPRAPSWPRSSGSTGCRPPSPARCGRSRRGPPTMREVAARFRCDPSTVSLAADKLQSVGLIARRPHPSDGRERTLVLTTAGTNCGRRSGHGCTPPASSPASTRRSSAPCRRCSPGCGRRGRATPPPAVPSFGNPFLRKGVDTSCGQGRGEWHCDTSEHARSSTTTTRRGRPGAGRHALGDTA